jgi:VIT1/CCC1 family predicted Fe2+/Mn2+ transporter
VSAEPNDPRSLDDVPADPGSTSGGPAGRVRQGSLPGIEPPERDATVPEPPVPQKHHRDVQGGVARASVFGASDGLVSNISLILGVAGAEPEPSIVRLAGIAGLIAGAVSMAAGEYVSMKAQSELLERELAIERTQLERQPHVETVELAQIYASRGIDPDTAMRMASELMADPEVALETHAREELGINPGELGSPVGAAVGSFFSFSAGAVIPLVPWFVTEGSAAVIASIVLGVIGAASIGIALATFTGRSKVFSAVRQVGIAVVAAGVTFGVGRAVGVNTS